MNNETAYRVRVSAAILRSPGEVLLVRQRLRGEDQLKFPGGRPQLGETLETALMREVAEETGHEVLLSEIAFVAEHHEQRWDEARLEVCFYGRIVGPSSRARDSEIVESLWLPLDDARATAQIPHIRGLENSSRGRYVDESVPTVSG